MLLTTCCAPDVFASALLRMRCIAVVSPSGIRQSGKGGSTCKGVRHAKGLCHGTRCGFEQAQGCLLVRSSLILTLSLTLPLILTLALALGLALAQP